MIPVANGVRIIEETYMGSPRVDTVDLKVSQKIQP